MPAELTQFEVDAIASRLPRPAFERLLDVCCGPGRHAAPLAGRGYDITGVDRDAGAVAHAAEHVPRGRFVELDMRDMNHLEGPFDAAIILWQSFGFFDPHANDRVLADIAALLRPGGRFLLDLFHRTYFEQNQGRIAPTRDPRCRSITNTMNGHRLASSIEYVDGSTEVMDFELFTPDDIEARASPFGLTAIQSCCWWDTARPPSSDEQRYQIMFERT